LADAVARGRHYGTPGNELTFQEYVYDQLSPAMRELWNKISECELLDSPAERVAALLANHGKQARQHLLIYALTQSMFNVSQSLRKLGISRKLYDSWKANDPEFAELCNEIHWHKNNFFEHAFIGRVQAGDTAAIIHAVKTRCRDRGYNEKIEVEHTGTITHEHTVTLADLDLPLDVRRAILDALRKRQQVVTTVAPTNGRPALLGGH